MNKIQTAPKLINKEKGKCIRCIKISSFVHFSTNLLFGEKKKKRLLQNRSNASCGKGVHVRKVQVILTSAKLVSNLKF